MARLRRSGSIVSMYDSDDSVIYEATAKDAVKLWYLSQVTGQARLRGRALICDIHGVPAAAISIADDRIVADPARATPVVTQRLRAAAQSLRAVAPPPMVGSP